MGIRGGDPVATTPTLADRRKAGADALDSARAALVVAAKELDGAHPIGERYIQSAVDRVDRALAALAHTEHYEREMARLEDEAAKAE